MPPSKSNIGWNFDNSYLRLGEDFGAKLNPTPVQNPQLVIINHELGKFLGLDFADKKPNELAKIFSGNQLPKGAKPFAQAYAGHQYGSFVILGDGRAHLFGEQITPQKQRFDIQLKGSGQTPFSRRGDGRAALGPMLREYIISEAMFFLGIPTSRSLVVVSTGELVSREEILPGAILTRVAASHIRVGTFQYFAAKRDKNSLKKLADHVIERHYPEASQDLNPYLSLLKLVIEKQVKLMVEWLRVGFVHGVMNSDNMAISGETIDYGPCAFMDYYDPATVFSSIDSYGRYAFANQPLIAKWNLARFAESILPLLGEEEKKAMNLAQDAIESFNELFGNNWYVMMRNKLGLIKPKKDDKKLVDNFLELLVKHQLDYTNSFYELSLGDIADEKLQKDEKFINWRQSWLNRVGDSDNKLTKAAKDVMQKTNPVVIPRNHKVEEVLAAAGKDDLSKMNSLLKVLQNPYQRDANTLPSEYRLPLPLKADPYKTFCGT